MIRYNSADELAEEFLRETAIYEIAHLVNEDPNIIAEQNVCMKCGAPAVMPNQKFCNQCGEPFKAAKGGDPGAEKTAAALAGQKARKFSDKVKMAQATQRGQKATHTTAETPGVAPDSLVKVLSILARSADPAGQANQVLHYFQTHGKLPATRSVPKVRARPQKAMQASATLTAPPAAAPAAPAFDPTKTMDIGRPGSPGYERYKAQLAMMEPAGRAQAAYTQWLARLSPGHRAAVQKRLALMGPEEKSAWIGKIAQSVR